MSVPIDGRSFFCVDGAVPYDAPCYVERPADRQLRELVLRGELCYILTASQMGKTSLIFHTRAELRTRDIPTAYLDLHRFGSGSDVAIEPWCRSFLNALASQLSLDVEVPVWWAERSDFTPIDRLLTFIQEVVCVQTGGAAIFVDEIGTILSLEFGDAFINGIRSLYQSFSNQTTRCRVAFVLIGMIPPDRLIRDRVSARLNVGSRLSLGELALDDAGALLEGLPGQNRAVLERVFYWTNGHPYLTQRICLAIAQDETREWNHEAVDDLVYWLLLVDRALELDSNLSYVRDAVVLSPNKDELVRLYGNVLRGHRVRNLEQSPLHRELRFCGLVHPDARGDLVVSNRVYCRVFDKRWVEANSSFRWWKAVPRYAWVAVGLITMLAILLAASLVRTIRGEQIIEEQSNLVLMRRLITNSIPLLESQYDLALLLGVEAYQTQQTSETEVFVPYSLFANPYISSFLRAHDAPVNTVVFGPGGTLFATGDDAGRIILWDSASREPLALAPTGHSAGVNTLAFAADLSFLVSGSCADFQAETGECRLGEVAMWNLADARLINRWAAHSDRVHALALSADGRYLATCGGSTLIVWDLVAHAATWRYALDEGEDVTTVTFSPTDPGLLVFGSESGDLGVVDVEARTLQLTFAADSEAIANAAFSPDGRLLASAGRDGVLALWQTDTWEPWGAPFTAHASAIYDIEFDADGMLFSTAADGMIYGWELTGSNDGVTRRLALTGQGNKGWSISIADTPHGRSLLSPGADNAIVWWVPDGDSTRGQWLMGHQGAILGLDFSADSGALASAGEDGIRLWSIRPAEPLEQAPLAPLAVSVGDPLLGHDGPVRRVIFQPRGDYLASVGRDGRVLLWEPGDESSRTLGEQGAIARAVAFAPDGAQLASADDLGRIWLWDVATGGMASGPIDNPIQAHGREIFDLAYSPDGRLLASGSWDGTVRFWDPITLQPIGDPVVTGVDEIWDIAFSPDGRILAVAGSGGVVPLIDVERRAIESRLLTNQTTRINALAFSPSGALLATGSSDSTIEVWDIADSDKVGLPLGRHSAAIYALAFSPDGRLLASADLGGGLFVSVIGYDEPVEAACAIARRNLTEEEWAQYVGQTRPMEVTCEDYQVVPQAPQEQ